MRKLATLFTMCLLTVVAWGQTAITFIPGETKGSQATVTTEDEMELDGITVHTSYGAFAAAQYRLGKNATTTFTSSVGQIVKIEFTCTDDYPSTGFSAPDGMDDGIWEGSAEEVTIVSGNKQVRATQIVVWVLQEGLATPRIKPNGGKFYEPVEVTISCSSEGSSIYYTTDGSNPSTGSKLYTAPFTLSSNTTVKAISTLNGEKSSVVSADFEFVAVTPVANIREYNGVADGTVVRFKNPVNVSAYNSNYLYVQDATGYALFFKPSVTYKKGDVVPAGFVGTKTTFHSEPELTYIEGLEKSTSTVTINPETITATQVGHATWTHYVLFKDVTIDPDAKTLTDASGTAPVFFSMGVTADQVVAGAVYDVEAIVGVYQPKDQDPIYQILPVKLIRKDLPPVGIGEMAEYVDNEMLTFSYDATVLAHYSPYLFAKDETGYGLIYDKNNEIKVSYKKGDIIPKGFSGQKITYNGEPELQTPLADFANPNGHVNVAPETITTGDFDHEHFAHYVVMYNVTVSGISGKNFNITDANGVTKPGYNQFNQDLAEGTYEKLEGIMASYRPKNATETTYQLYPIIESVPVDVRNLKELFELPSGRQGHFTEPLTAIYQYKDAKYLFVQDVDKKFGLVYGYLAPDFTNGDIINDAIASWSIYNEVPEVVPVQNFTVAGHSAIVTPFEVPSLEDVSKNQVNYYVKISDVTIAPTEKNLTYMLADETYELQMYNRFGLETIPEDEATHTVWGFLSINQGTTQVLPISIDEDPFPPVPTKYIKGDVNGDGNVNISDINMLISIILGYSGDARTMVRADVNKDGNYNISDINDVISVILSGEVTYLNY